MVGSHILSLATSSSVCVPVTLEMEKKEEIKWEQEEVQEQEQAQDETTLILRKSRYEKDDITTEIYAVDLKVSNGVSESNGHAVAAASGEDQKAEESDDDVLQVSVNGSDDKISIPGEEQKIEDAGIEAEAINGEQKPENLVFYDKVEGIWKCRICSWTYGNGSVCVHHIQNHKGLMSVKTLNFEFEGVGSTHKILKDLEETNKFNISSLDSVIQNGTVIRNTFEGALKCDNLSGSNIQPAQNLFQDHCESYKSSKEIIESVEDDLINDGDLEGADFDVERVLQKQTTHDLYCPNCNSCITKRVIVRKRKRRIQISDEDVKPSKKETAVASKLGADSAQSSCGQVPVTDEVGDDNIQLGRADVDERNQGPDIFRCLSCFSFFTPIGNGLFRLFEQKNGKKSVADDQGPNSILASNKQEPTVEPGTSSQTVAGISDASNLNDEKGEPSFQQNGHSPSHASEGSVPLSGSNDTMKTRDNVLTFPKQKPSSNGKVVIAATDQSDMAAPETVEEFDSYTEDQLKEPKSSKEGDVSRENGLSVIVASTTNQFTNGESMEDAASFPEGGLKLLLSPSKGSPATDNSMDSQIPNQTMQSGVSHPILTKPMLEPQSGEPLKVNNILCSPAGQGQDAVIIIEPQPMGSSEIMPNAIHSVDTTTSSQPTTQVSIAEERKELKIEVIKSIVYGGLAESITSLSVVSSAAGGGAATLNVLALGMANLIGGLFIICHNILELRDERIEQVSNQISEGEVEQRDRYKKLLGRRRNFIIHATVAIISYLVFGLVPPAVYGFSFHKTDDKQLKLVVVATASLICIVVLAIGRAYVRSPPKPYLKSVMAFVILGFMVSGVSYAAGELVERLLVKLGLFQSGTVSNLLVPQMTPTGTGTAWASY